jgi:hypothetical protein
VFEVGCAQELDGKISITEGDEQCQRKRAVSCAPKSKPSRRSRKKLSAKDMKKVKGGAGSRYPLGDIKPEYLDPPR